MKKRILIVIMLFIRDYVMTCDCAKKTTATPRYRRRVQILVIGEYCTSGSSIYSGYFSTGNVNAAGVYIYCGMLPTIISWKPAAKDLLVWMMYRRAALVYLRSSKISSRYGYSEQSCII